MTDLLIRNLDPALRRKLEASAARNGRSLSREAAALLGSALGEDLEGEKGSNAIDQLLGIAAKVQLSSDEEDAFFSAISPAGWRSRPDPDFEGDA